MTWVIVAIAASLLLALVVVFLYNRLVRLRNRVENAWAQVDVQLQRRHDLIPNLVETVEGYAGHERSTFEEVTAARASAQQARTVEQHAEAENVLTAALGRLFAVAEAYPQLRATENFQQLQSQLDETEGRIAVARQMYNDAVLTYDTARETFPTSDPPGTAIVLTVAITAIWLVVVGIVYLRHRPHEPEAGPPTLDLGPEPPAVANLLVSGFRVTHDAVPATLLDLSARGLVELEERAPGSYVCRLREAPEGELQRYERRVLDLLRRRASDGIVP